jgi:heme/copper-type cytochrome/quinol oxidase subunit 3
MMPAATTTGRARAGVDGRLGMWLFVAADAMSFLHLLVAYVYLRFQSSDWPSTAQALGKDGLPQAFLATFVLLGSTITMRLTTRAAQQGRRRSLVAILLITATLGAGFLALQAHEYTQLLSHGARPATSLFHACFFATTSFHGLHVAAGLVWLLVILGRLFGEGEDGGTAWSVADHAARRLGIAEIYWQFVDAVWVVIFIVFYVSQR